MTESATFLDVPTQNYYDAANICAKAASDMFTAFKTGMRSFGDTTLMAGSVGDGKLWGESYDQQAADVYSMSIDLVLALDGYAQVLKQAGYNHALADHDPSSGTPEPTAPNTTPSFSLSPQELADLLVPPSAGGPGRGIEDYGLDLMAKIGIPVPDGNTEKLNKSADVWNALATSASVTAIPDQLERAAALFETVTSPDANFIDEDLRELKSAASDLAGAYGELAQACRDQKNALEDLRKDLYATLDDLAEQILLEIGISLAVGLFASSITFGAAATVVAARTAKAIDNFIDIIRAVVKASKLKAVVVVEKITAARKAAVERIKDLATKLLERAKAAFTSRKNFTDLFANGRTPKASELKAYAESQGWTPSQTPNGPLKYTDSNGVVRLTIKQGSSRAPGSANPHVEIRDANGQRTDPFGAPVTRKSTGNHTPIDWDL